jgi:paraquat-inducible protein B
MTQDNGRETQAYDAAEAVVQERRGLSIVWLIPLVAVIIGGWLAYKTLSQKGPTITITFKSADGLEAGKTRIRYKAVNVGVVDNIDVSEDLSNVIVTASLKKDVKPYLTDGTKFWVVRPRLGAGGVSGLSTLISGAYIEIEPGEGEPVNTFKGLEVPAVIRAGTPGHEYALKSPRLGSLQAGSPVYFHDLKVGEVTGTELNDDEQSFTLHIFVNHPHHGLVRDNSRFWNASGVDVSIGADGMQIRTQSVQALLSGGIAFDSPAATRDESEPAQEGAEFKLHQSLKAAKEAVFQEKEAYVLFFDGSMRGVTVGAAVQFRGIKVGAVTDMRLEYNVNTLTFRIPVFIQLEPGRIRYIGEGGEAENPGDDIEALKILVAQGLRAQLQTGSLLTGQRYVELGFHPDSPPAELQLVDNHYQLPTIPSTIDEFRSSATQMLAKLREVPIDQIAEEVLGTVQGTNRIMNSPELTETLKSLRTVTGRAVPLASSLKATSDAAAAAAQQAEQTLATIETATAEDSALNNDLTIMLREFAVTARSMRALADYLERHPEAFLSGKGGSGK